MGLVLSCGLVSKIDSVNVWVALNPAPRLIRCPTLIKVWTYEYRVLEWLFLTLFACLNQPGVVLSDVLSDLIHLRVNQFYFADLSGLLIPDKVPMLLVVSASFFSQVNFIGLVVNHQMEELRRCFVCLTLVL